MCFRAVLCLINVLIAINLDLCSGDSVIERCKEYCKLENNPVGSSSPARICEGDCLGQCVAGCELWRSSLQMSCLESCNITLEMSGDVEIPTDTVAMTQSENYSPKVAQCVSGCNKALDLYAQDVDNLVCNITAPVLVAGSKTDRSVILSWWRPTLTNVTYVVQKLFVNLSEEWEQHTNVTWLDQRRIRVEGLHPYVTYRFRVVIVVSPQHTVISPESVPIPTKESGVPSGQPLIQSLSASSTSVHLKWKAPYFVNAPLLGYKLTIAQEDGEERIKDISPQSQQVVSEVITLLRPDTQYRVKIAARNRYGLGPPVEKLVRTQPRSAAEGTTPYLILGSDNSIRKQDLDDLFMSTELYRLNDTSNLVTGLAIHRLRHQIYFVDSEGVVRVLDDLNAILDQNNPVSRQATNPIVARIFYRSEQEPRAISVDWLHNHLYIAEKHQITRCNVENQHSNCRPVIGNLSSRPEDITVDPGNGYLFWVQQRHEGGGLYRVDLADLSPQSILSNPIYSRIIVDDQMTALMVDYPNYRILFPNETRNSLMSVYLDGTDLQDIRQGVPGLQFINVKSLTQYNGVLYWTIGDRVLFEEYEQTLSQYRHNDIYIQGGSFIGLNIWHPTSQPLPLPLMPPKKLEVLFSANSATLSWEEPDMDQGRGAWHSWDYEIEEVNHEISKVSKDSFEKLSTRKWQVRDLKPDTLYSFRARAYSNGGHGPWSAVVNGTTLASDALAPYLLYVNEQKVCKINLDGSGQGEVFDLSSFRGQTVQEVETYGKMHFFTLSNNSVVLQEGDGPMAIIPDVVGASVVAYDWLAKTLYWSSPRHNMIQRMRLGAPSPRQPETIYQGRSAAVDIVLDSEKGFIYWTTQNSIEMARLSGRGQRTIHSQPQFLGRYIFGLAIDLHSDTLYWVMKKDNDLTFFRMQLITRNVNDGKQFPISVESDFANRASYPSLQFYSNKLFWASVYNSITVQDLRGKSLASIHVEPPREITSFTVVHQGKGHRPGSRATNQSVIPPAILLDTVKIRGTAREFHVTWQDVPVDEGLMVHYDVLIECDHCPDKKSMHKNDLRYAHFTLTNIDPYTNLTLTLKPCTDWGCNETEPNKVIRRSPEAAPSVPTKLRKYVTYHRNHLTGQVGIEVEIRWGKPEKMNGVLDQYIVEMKSSPSGRWTSPHRQKARRRIQTIYNADPNTEYYFRVQACTLKGCGNWTDVVHVNTADEKPIPMLLTVDSKLLRLFYVDDKDYKANITQGQIMSLTFIAQEDTFYYIDASKEIKKLSGENETDEEAVVEVDGSAKSLAMDWISRDLYWLEDKPAEENRIMKYSLSRDNSEVHPVITRHATLWQIAIDPLHSAMFWTETRNNTGYLMRCRIDGSNIHSIDLSGNATSDRTRYKYRKEDSNSRTRSRSRQRSRQRSRRAAQCNCQHLQISIGHLLELDHTNPDRPELYIVDNVTGSVWATDTQGCLCRLVVDAQSGQDLGLPPDSMTIGSDRLYWTNKGLETLNSVLKLNGSDYIRERNNDAPTQIVAYGSHLQPMPGPGCLLVGNYTDVARNIVTANTTVDFTLMPWQYAPGCADVSVPAVKYTVFYRVMTSNQDYSDCGSKAVCDSQDTYSTNVSLTDLVPDTVYQIQIKVSNPYTRGPNRVGDYQSFKTKIGIPSAPRNAHIEVLSYSEIRVLWDQPENLNGPSEDLLYDIDWYTLLPNGTRRDGLQNVTSPETDTEKSGTVSYYTDLTKLSPNQTYYAKVRAHNRHRNGYSASPSINSTTFVLPSPLVAEPVNSTTIRLLWEIPEDDSVIYIRFQRSEMNAPKLVPDAMILHKIDNASQSPLEVMFHNLRPDTVYHFGMVLMYRYKPADNMIKWPKVPVSCATPVGVPSRPQPPQTNTAEQELMVEWHAPYDGGLPIISYLLEYLDKESGNWTLVYNDSATQWTVSDIPSHSDYVFRVAAINALGAGDFSLNESLRLQPIRGYHIPDYLSVILGSAFAGIIVIVLLVALFIFMRLRQDKKKKKIPFSIVPGQRNSPDMELAILRELPRVTVQTSNALYAINIIPTDEDVAALPHFRREHLTLTKFLGSGAFGEVFEGIAKNILSTNSGETRVAVKTLRKGATDQEKEEFLKEALLMSNFRYDLILRLLGVCLDNDPQFIILELMEGGDLLSYLRSSRPTPTSSPKLNLPDMVGICVDVSMGCRYLEDMHFVHRDLAARNCLVSSQNREIRVVKIGDFGLARDIYKNDYYRKEGEGLLPVRWMSPESLIDGVFTTQSDVWAFGVLMWEVLTLGQQPYPARTNLEVLHYVRSGGRLDRPDNCPDDLYTLMLKCWCYNPDERPSFTYILGQLEGFKRRSLDPSSDFSGRNGEVEALPPLACPSRLYDDDKALKRTAENCQMMREISGSINGTVKLPSAAEKNPKLFRAHLGSSYDSIHKGEPQLTVDDKLCTPNNPNSRRSGSYRSDREDEQGYLSPVSSPGNHKYLELVGSSDLDVEITRDSIHSASSRGSSRPPSGASLGIAPEIPQHLLSTCLPESKQQEPEEKKNGYLRNSGKPNISIDPKTGKTLCYSQLATSPPDSEAEQESATKAPKVRTPYRGPHAGPWTAPSGATNLTVFRDIAGRSVPAKTD